MLVNQKTKKAQELFEKMMKQAGEELNSIKKARKKYHLNPENDSDSDSEDEDALGLTESNIKINPQLLQNIENLRGKLANATQQLHIAKKNLM